MFAFAFPRRLSLWIKMAWIKSVSISLKYKNKVWSIGRVVCSQKQGRIHGYSSRVRVGRSRAGEGHQGIWSGVVCSTRPDTRPPVADGWAGAEMRVFPLFNSSVTDGPTDQRTDRPTDGPTDGRTDIACYRDARTHLKRKIKRKKERNKERKKKRKFGGNITFDSTKS